MLERDRESSDDWMVRSRSSLVATNLRVPSATCLCQSLDARSAHADDTPSPCERISFISDRVDGRRAREAVVATTCIPIERPEPSSTSIVQISSIRRPSCSRVDRRRADVISGRSFSSEAGCDRLVSAAATRSGPDGMVDIYDANMQRRLELQIDASQGYRTRAGQEYPVAGLQACRVHPAQVIEAENKVVRPRV